MDWKEVIENLKYLISEDCTDTQFDYADEIEIAIRVMESQEDLYSKINKALEQTYKVRDMVLHSNRMYEPNDVLEIIDEITACFERNIGE